VHTTQLDQNVTATLSYPPIYLILSLLAREGAIFVKIFRYFYILASWWSEVVWFGQFVILQINYDVIKLQEYQLWSHFGDVIKLRNSMLKTLRCSFILRKWKGRRCSIYFHKRKFKINTVGTSVVTKTYAMHFVNFKQHGVIVSIT